MTASILDNELVKKYFGGHPATSYEMAFRVLQAMQEPIRKGERYLEFIEQLGWREAAANPAFAAVFHPYVLRLPSRFQGEEKPASVWKKCPDCNAEYTHPCSGPAPVPTRECEGIALWSQSHCPGCTATQIPRKPFPQPPASDGVKFEFPLCPHQFEGWCRKCMRELVALVRAGK